MFGARLKVFSGLEKLKSICRPINCRETANIGTYFDGTKFSPENRYIIRMLASTLPLIVQNMPYCPDNATFGGNFENSRRRIVATLKMVKSLYPGRNSSDSDEFLYADANFDCKNSDRTNNQNFSNPRCGRTPFRKSFSLYLNEIVITWCNRQFNSVVYFTATRDLPTRIATSNSQFFSGGMTHVSP